MARRLSTRISPKELEKLELLGEFGYRQPEESSLLEIANAHVRKPSLSLSPDRCWLLQCDSPKYTPLSHLSANEISVAGIRIHTEQFNKSRNRSYYNQLSFLPIQKIREQIKKVGQSPIIKETPIKGLPENALLRSVKWSPDSKFLSFLVVVSEEVQLWVADVASATANQVAGSINASLAISSYLWGKNSRELIFMKAVNKGKSIPRPPIPPFSPSIRSNLQGSKATARTYQNLLTCKYDEELFHFFGTSVATKVEISESGNPVEEVDFEETQGIMRYISLSPNGKYLLTKTIREPFSYLVPYYRFPHSNYVWNLESSPVSCVFEQQTQLQEQVPTVHDAVTTGPRLVDWIPSSEDALFWIEAQDKGDPRTETEVRDKLFALAAPFDKGQIQLLHSLSSRYNQVDWSHAGFAWLEERSWKNRWSKVYKIEFDHSLEVTKETLIFDRSYEDVYHSPGSIRTAKDNRANFVIQVSNQRDVLLKGKGATPKGDLPFLHRFDTVTKETTELWRCSKGNDESIHVILEDDGSEFITLKESNTEQPNIWLYKQTEKGDYQAFQISDFPHPYPWLDNIRQELVTYSRPDGVLLSAKLYTPKNFKQNEDKPLPMLVWAYPREFTNKEAANQVKITASTFTTISATSPIYWVTQGYAVLSQASMPIVSAGKKTMEDANDTFIEQLVSNAKTHVHEMVDRKIADPKRIACGGHSYGAFMTAHLLAHTNLFCAGIARSGAYNRTLTPFGFQSEDRTLWESGDLYYKLSPFNHADKIKAPLLLSHGELDCNSGTYPEQSVRFYNALKGNGCVTRLIVLPYEDHSYKSKENTLHLLWETGFWLYSFVMNKK